jgi:hypothetical protein
LLRALRQMQDKYVAHRDRITKDQKQ